MSELVLRLAVKRLRLLALAEETTPLNPSVSNHLDSIQDELDDMQLLLQRPSTDELRKIEDMTHRIEDIIERHRDIGISRRKSSKTLRLLKMIIFMRYSSPCAALQQISSQIKDIVSCSKSLDANEEGIEWPVKKENWKQMDLDRNLFGIDANKNQALQIITGGAGSSNNPESAFLLVIPICGVAGSGKTTLAKEISIDQMVLKEFGTCIWIDILPDKFDMAKRQLVNEVHKRRCKSQRSLVVLDDMRSTEAWDTLRTTLQQLEKGSKILVTTQSGYIAEYISPMQYVHRMKLLDKPHCLALFKEVFSSHDRAGQMTTNAMEIMVETCEGVPQLIKELALNLAYMSKDKKNMEHKVSRKCRSNFLFQYYQKLPDHLKPCFLYLVHFLENQEIDLERLSHLWKVEGLLSTNEHARGERMMDVAERYLRELALKGMIELVKEEEVPTYKEFRACRTTGAIRNLCHDLSGEQQTFLKVMDLSQDDYSLSSDAEPCRLFIYLGNHPLVVAPKVAKNVRSLQIARGNKHQEPEFCWQSELLKFKEFKVLRILDFDGIDFQGQGLPAGILSLVPLKYLSFKGCILEELPSSISKLSYLQILDLRVKLVSNKTTKIPNVLWKMERLNHLYLPVRFETGNGEKLRLDTLTDLETLENFNTSVCKADDVSKFSNLQYVAAKVEGDFKDFVSITRHMKTPPTTQLYSSIDIINLDCYAEERHSVLRDLLRCKVVRVLHFKGHIGRLPPYGEISKSFTQLVLNRSHLNEDSMITLQKLPSLRVLVLSDDAYMGEKMVCSASGFPQLKHLHLLNLPSLRSLEVETTAMPLLSTLNVKSCLNQRILRDCLNFRAGLRIVQS